MRPVWRKARALMGVWVSHMTVYRAEIIIWMLSGMIPLIMMAVWIGKANAAGGEVGGFSPQAFAAYFLAAWLSAQLTVAWVAWELDHQVREGKLSPKLLRPIDPIWENAAAHVAEKVVRLPFILAILLIGTLLVPGTVLTPGPLHVLAFALSIALAFAIRFLIAYCIGILTFWLNQATALDEFYWILSIFLSGNFAPLTFFPPVVRDIAALTPFPYVVYYPVRVLTGAADAGEIGRTLLAQSAWVLGLAALRLLLWRRGLLRYGAAGA
ncbi:MAG TPA: ABC-2 family transporter protein [Deinococcales bacterium]|nr:ABC-2 family transporter protein [Deinococcales bacterium]